MADMENFKLNNFLFSPLIRAPPIHSLADAFVELLKGEEQNEHSKNVCYY